MHAAHRVLRLTGIHDVQRDRPSYVPDGEVARHLVVVVRRALDAGTPESDGRELLDVQEVWGLQVRVATRVVGDQGVGIDRCFHRRGGEVVLAQIDRHSHAGEMPLHGHQAHVLG